MENPSISHTNCKHCSAAVLTDERFCGDCGYPENGTDNERSHFIAKKVMKTRSVNEDSKKIKSGRNTLFVISAILFLGGAFAAYMANGDLSIFIESTILAIIYFCLGLWASNKPFISLLLALLLFITTNLINGIIYPATLARGIIFKVIIIVFLGKALYAAFEQRSKS